MTRGQRLYQLLLILLAITLPFAPPVLAQPSQLDPTLTQVSAGISHSCALTTAGGVKCWGYNFYGQLGDGSTAQRLTPIDVSGLTSGVAAIAAGGYHTCALTTACGVKCWGRNTEGQLGDGSTTQRLTPVIVSSLASGVTASFTLNSYAITAIANPVAGGSVGCTPNPVNHGSNSTCTATANAPYVFSSWSGDCTGATCLLSNVTAPRSVAANFAPTLNVDGSAAATRYHALVDGLIVVRFMRGVTGTALTAGTSVAGAAITDPAVIAAYLSSLGTLLDIDGNGAIDPAIDGLLIMRYMLGLRGDALIADALGTAPRARSTAAAIEAWLAALMP